MTTVVATRLVFAAISVALGLAGAGCGPSGPQAGPADEGRPTLRAPAPARSDPAATAEQAALAAYRGMWAAYDRAGGPPAADPDDKDLAVYATGDALQALVDGLSSLREQGLVFEGEFVTLPEVIDLSPASAPTEAQIRDCADSTGWSVVRADGGPYEDEPGGRRLIIADVEDDGSGVWRVTGFAARNVGSC